MKVGGNVRVVSTLFGLFGKLDAKLFLSWWKNLRRRLSKQYARTSPYMQGQYDELKGNCNKMILGKKALLKMWSLAMLFKGDVLHLKN